MEFRMLSAAKILKNGPLTRKITQMVQFLQAIQSFATYFSHGVSANNVMKGNISINEAQISFPNQ